MTIGTWPPTLADLKADRGIDLSDTRDDVALGNCLVSSIGFVQRVRTKFNYTNDPMNTDPSPDTAPDMWLGTVRLAARWFSRRESPDAMISMGDLGTGRVTSFDADIDRLLRIGRHSTAMVL